MMQFQGIPLVTLGPGSQPVEEDLQYMALPREVDSFAMPYLPTAEETTELSAAKAILASLIEQMADGNATAYATVDHLDAANRTLLAQVLGEGEVSARVKLLNGHELCIQESVFAGVWRVLQYDTAGQLLADWVETSEIPCAVWQQAAAFAHPTLTPLAIGEASLMNAPAVIHELAQRVASYHSAEDDHVINLSLLPMTPEDIAYIDAHLGGGNSGVFSRGYGKCRVMSTQLQHVWRVQYFNGMNQVLLDTIEICRIPEVVLAAEEDRQDAKQRLQEALAWLSGVAHD